MICRKIIDDVRHFIEKNYVLQSLNADQFSKDTVMDSCTVYEASFSDEKICSTCSPDIEHFISERKDTSNFQDTLQRHIAEQHLDNATVYTKALGTASSFRK